VRLADLVLLVVDLSVDHPEEQVFETCGILEEHKVFLKREGESKPQGSVAVKPTLLVGTKTDMVQAIGKTKALRLTYGKDFPLVLLSIRNETNVDGFKKEIFKGMKVIRVYTKIPGKKADMDKPYVLPVGTTVQEAAMTIHKELAEMMTFARLWGSDKYDGQRIERDHVMEDGDIIEIHTR